ncbi:PAS domain S-box-containing protein [Prosthecobacter fusiformis]|uniref:histidine kinase n=1 Tax=Prosthecobacter fusiformis TaxID=48464 RepID=A0A4V3FI89_9BACT|nr:PAS domain-containing protein [Prosthecobacter fusiformis]TDU81493.1 PAS domain S-box-containing protein [Prosthecobacter fusiformis]
MSIAPSQPSPCAPARHDDAETLAFLNRLTQAVLGLSSPEQIIVTVERMLGEHLEVSRVLVAEASADGETVLVPQTWEAEGMLPLKATTHRLADYGDRLLPDYRAGRPHVRRDACREYSAGPELEALKAIGAVAAIDVPVLIDGIFYMLFVVHQATPRDWTEGEISLVRQVADRTAAEVQRARALREVQASELRFRQMADSMPQIVWTAKPDGIIDYSNRKWHEYTGLPEHDLASLSHEAVVHEEDRARMRAAWEQAVSAGSSYEQEVRLRYGGDGSYRWFINRGLPVRDTGGRVTGWYGTLTDIHDQRMAAEAGWRNEQRLVAALDVADMGTFDWDVRTDAVTMDARSRELFGFDDDQSITAQALFGRIVPSMVSEVQSAAEISLRELSRMEIEYDIRHPAGEVRTVVSISNVAVGTDGQPERLYGVLGDGTNRKRAEMERERFLRTIEVEKANLAAVVEKAPAFICVLRGPEHVFELANEDYYRLAGRRDIIGRTVRAVFPEVEGQGFFEMLDQVYQTGESVSGTEVPLLLGPEERGPARLRFVSFVYQALRDPDGNVSGIFVHGVDMTDAVQVRQALVTSERRRKAALDAAGVGAFNIDITRQDLEADERFRAIFGVKADNLSYADAFAIIHADDREMVRDKVAAATDAKDPQPYAVEYRVVHPDGSIHWVAARGKSAFEGVGDDQQMASFNGTVTDITAQKHAEDELEFQRHQLELIFRESPAAMALWRGDELIFERVNPEYQSLFGNDRQLVGKALLEAVPELEGQGFDEAIRKVLHTGVPFTGTEVLARFASEDGGPPIDRYFDFTYLQVRDPDGCPYGVYDHAVDVTGRVLARRDLEKSQALLQQALSERQSLLDAERAARMEAEQASRMKDEFLATLSHELRTPLNAIVGWTELLHMTSNPSEDLLEGLEVISRNAKAQTQIIEDILDMSRIVNGKLRLSIQPIHLSMIVTAAVETLQPAANGKGVQLQVEAGQLGGRFHGDPNRLQQVLWNLISNALKFTPKGGRVQVSLRQDSGQMEISVTDSGEGIAPEFLPHIFDRFRQADSSTTRIHGGLGLGLSIVKQIVEMHGGTVSADSPGKGQGATFTVCLPLGSLPADAESSAPTASPNSHIAAPAAAFATGDHPLGGLSVVAVDDEPDAVAFLQRLLTANGARVRIAHSAAEALALILEEPPDLLLSDIGMPVEDGYSLIRKVRALPPAEGGGLPAIALTAYARTVDRVKALEAGFQMHLSKPVEPAELIASIVALARLRQ